MRVALYARVSKDNGKQDTANQLHELTEFCQRSNWEIVHEYIDRATGKNSDRPQLQRMFSDASKRHFDLVLFWALDRFSREGVFDTLNHLQRLSAAGVGWRSYTEQFFDSAGPFKDAVISIMATLAKMEREKISERTKAGLRRARRAGKVLGRPRLAPETAKRIIALRKSGMSFRVIARQLDVGLSTVVRVLARKAAA